jgi:opacity protein-like surface antigen
MLEMIKANVYAFAKAKLGKSISVMVGPQFDFLTNAKTTLSYPSNTIPAPGDENYYDTFKNTSTGITGGIELAPSDKWAIYARYMGGLVDMNRGDDWSGNVAGDYKNSSFHLGVKWRLPKLPLVGSRVYM